MEIADTFIPTAGAVGVLPMVTYFFLVVATFAFVGLFIFSSVLIGINSTSTRPISRLPLALIAFLAVVSGVTYYVLQGFYHNVLAELVTVSETADRQTFVREAYNSLSQYRYIAWFINTPLLVFQLVFLLPVRLWRDRRLLISMLVGSLAVVFFSFVGHQQLSFDNEVQAGPMTLWGFLALGAFGFTLFTVNRFQKEHASPNKVAFRWAALTLSIIWVIYFIGYFLTLTSIDFNALQLLFTFADIVSVVGISKVVFLVYTNRWPSDL